MPLGNRATADKRHGNDLGSCLGAISHSRSFGSVECTPWFLRLTRLPKLIIRTLPCWVKSVHGLQEWIGCRSWHAYPAKVVAKRWRRVWKLNARFKRDPQLQRLAAACSSCHFPAAHLRHLMTPSIDDSETKCCRALTQKNSFYEYVTLKSLTSTRIAAAACFTSSNLNTG